jgi:hypothetical protein
MYFWDEKLKRIRWVEHVARIGEFRSTCKMLFNEPKEKR